MRVVSVRSLFVLGVLVLALSGCGGKTLPRFVWPPPPDQPRMEWVGNYYSEISLKSGALGKFLGDQENLLMTTPFGIVSDANGRVFVSDIHRSNVWVFDFNEKTAELLSKNSGMKSPAGLALDAAGHLYIADVGKGVVWVYDTSGKPLRVIGDKGVMTKPAYIAIDGDTGRIFVSDGVEHNIAIFDKEGTLIKKFGERGNQPGQFFAPQGLAIGPDHRLYVADMLNARVQYFDLEGNYLDTFGIRGDQIGQFENPKDLAFDSEGNLHVVDGRRSELLTFTGEGELLLVTGEGAASTSEFGFTAPRAIFIDKNDRIYISESVGRRFSVWQYMSAAYLKRKPYTDADRDALQKYIESLRVE